ncbi:MAG TPA: hypothetical protein PK255_03590 [Candidatus Pacearchaeota archaeon]|nr:hypothetical protein [Candidatus Pacearchaeota archaeon]HQI57584.1 hypothetical protein [Candidatus Pacearchaeota archaeon]HQJ58141.1 hypothetical protein [Candidatus Pacearchaeota archaeon]
MIEESITSVINKINLILSKIEADDFKEIKELKIPEQRGIYLIKEKGKEHMFYIGSANKRTLDKRLKNHLQGSLKNSIVRKKLVEKWEKRKLKKNELEFYNNKYKDNLNEYLQNNCVFIFEDINDFDEVLAIEHLLILYYRKVLRKKGLELLNDYKE